MYKAYMRGSASILKNTGKPCFIRLFLPLSSSTPMWPYELQSSKPTAVTPEHLMGRYWIFLLFPFWIQTRKWKNKENTKIREPCCGYTLGTPIVLKWDVYLCISEGIIRYSSYCEMSSYCRASILSQIWMQTLKLCKSKSFVLAYYTTRRLLEGFQNLEVFEASSCLFQYWWCGRRKGKPCVWMAQSFLFYMWLDTEMLCHAAETLFSFNSISRWDIAPSPQT